MKIILIEDDKNIGRNIKEYLEEYNHICDWESDGEVGYNKVKNNSYDFIILDLMLPGKDGISISKDLRKLGVKSPIIMLTAKDSIDSKIQGFDSGADDYIVKPFSLKELLLRIEAMSRRLFFSDQNFKEIKLKNLKINLSTKEVFDGKTQIVLTKKEFQILEFLIQNKNKVVSKKEIIEHIWGINNDIWSDVVRSHMQTLRAKLNGDLIQTVRGMGFIIKD